MAANALTVEFGNRTNFAEQALLWDIEKWQHKMPDESAMEHHIQQFYNFCVDALAHLNQEQGAIMQQQGIEEIDNARISFKAHVVGMLTAQWMLLRQVASLRLEGSPYHVSQRIKDVPTQVHIDALDQETARYYNCLTAALPPSGTQYFADASSPLIFLGRSAQLSFFSEHNSKAPVLIGVPFGVIYEQNPANRARLAIAHEVAHAIFDSLPDYPKNLAVALQAKLKVEHPPQNRQQQVLHNVIIKWLSEIVADLTGVALTGPKFVRSGLNVLAIPEAVLGITDEEHPLPIIRPFIGLAFLNRLKEKVQYTKEELDEINKGLLQDVENFSAPYLDRRFEAISTLTIISIEQVKNETLAILPFIWDCEFSLMGEQTTLSSILVKAAQDFRAKQDDEPDSSEIRRSAWGDVIKRDEPFLLRLSNRITPEYAIPAAFADLYCCLPGFSCTCPL